MPRNIALLRIIDATLDAISDAHRQYEIMTGGSWLNEAPEYFLTTIIAQTLSQLPGSKYITLEHNIKHAMDAAGATTRGPALKRATRGRCDIVVWWGYGTPRGMIEVKRPLRSYHDGVRKDLTRIQKVLLKNGKDHSFQFGLLPFFTSVGETRNECGLPHERLKKKLENLESTARESAMPGISIDLKHGQIIEVVGDAWAAACIVIQATANVDQL